MMRSLYSAVSGLKGHQTRMDVIGNNIANVNTTGFKSSRVNFEDMITQTLSSASSATDDLGGTNPKQIGLGVSVGSIDTLFTDGTAQSTGKNTDLALSGNGLFVVKNGNQTYYTRDGAFQFDADGNYVLPSSGLYVQGWTATNGVLNTSGGVGNIQIPAGKSMGSKTSTVASYVNNLNASTTGYDISSLLITYTDGTTETATSYSPTSSEGKITVTLSDGTTAVADSGNPFTTGTDAGKIWTSEAKSITANSTGTADITVQWDADKNISNYAKVNGSTSGTLDIKGLTSGTYTIGGNYTVEKTIDNAVSNGDGTVTLNFTDTSDGVKNVTVPQPTNGTYKSGDKFTVNLYVGTGTASAGATVTAANGQTVTIPTGTATLGNDYIYSSTATVQSIKRADAGTYINNGKTVSSVSVVTADGDTLTGLNGASYKANDTFYPTVTTSVTAYDSLGTAHSIPVLLTKSGNNTWSLSLTGGSNAATITESDGSSTSVTLTSSDLVFDSNGKYVSGSGTLSCSYTNGAADQTVALNLVGLTQYAGNSTINDTTDGHAAGTLSSVAIDKSGLITGTYTNGVKQTEAQVAIAQFTHAAGLEKTGSSLYQVSNNSGTPNVKTASDLGVTITPSALEMSNVDISDEFTNMIVTQRGFQSNSKIITVDDELLETVINMKR